MRLAMTYEAGKNELYWGRFSKKTSVLPQQFLFLTRNMASGFERLNADGSVKVDAKGTEWKCAFHLVRALVYTLEALRRMEAARTSEPSGRRKPENEEYAYIRQERS